MISKEKLLGGYIKNEEGELMDLFVDAARYHIRNVEILKSNEKYWDFYCIRSGDGAVVCDYSYIERHNLKELTIDDFKLKPKTKVTYELVTDMTINEIAKAMIDGEVFYNKYGETLYKWDGTQFINNNGFSFHCDGNFYRKVEKEIDWRDEAAIFVSENGSDDSEYAWHIDGIDLTDESFKELCHLVAELTDKPE